MVFPAKQAKAFPSAAFRLACVLAVSLPTAATWATNLPPGFVETVFAPVSAPVAIDWAPDGALWVTQVRYDTEIGTRIWRFRSGQLILAATLNGDNHGERGIHAIAVDPDYLQNHYLWVYYTARDPVIHNRLSRFTEVGGILQNEVVILEGPPVVNEVHNGGCLDLASDGTLFLGIGDDGLGSHAAQDPFEVRGKILHMNRDGSGASDNPYLDGNQGDPRVWAIGLRNPFRCNLQPGAPGNYNLFITDVGASSWEEVNIGIAGGNFGWAAVEGPEPTGLPGFVYPIYVYPHGNPAGSAVIGGAHVPPGVFHPGYEGNYFFGDWARGEIYRMVLDENNTPLQTEVWATNRPQPADFKFGPDGALYYAAQSGGSVRRIAYLGGGNQQPVASAEASVLSGAAPLTVTLDGSGSYDPEGGTLTYSWDFGDGGSETGAKTVIHSYLPGAYEASLTVTDPGGLEATAPSIRIVAGNSAPSVSLESPPEGLSYNAGEEIAYSAVATDPEEGDLSCAQFAWQVTFHHGGHAHPFLGPVQGHCAGSFTTSLRGETAADTWYEVRATARDSGLPLGSDAALATSRSVEIFPNTSLMSFKSSPLPDLTLKLDTVPFTPTQTVEGVVNFIREIGAVDGQVRNGHIYRWVSWSDGGARDHEIATPAENATFVATFGCNVLEVVRGLTIAKGENEEIVLSWLPTLDPCLSRGAERYRIYVASSLFSPGFAVDPPFTLVGVTNREKFNYVPAAEDLYFLVVAVGSDGLEGPSDDGVETTGAWGPAVQD